MEGVRGNERDRGPSRQPAVLVVHVDRHAREAAALVQHLWDGPRPSRLQATQEAAVEGGHQPFRSPRPGCQHTGGRHRASEHAPEGAVELPAEGELPFVAAARPGAEERFDAGDVGTDVRVEADDVDVG